MDGVAGTVQTWGIMEESLDSADSWDTQETECQSGGQQSYPPAGPWLVPCLLIDPVYLN